MHVAVICGYGLFDPKLRSSIEFQGLIDYYGAVFQDIRGKSDIEHVVLCGGYTNPERPELSEAQSVKDRIDDHVIDGPNRQLILEQRSSNTVQNIEFGLEAFRCAGVPVSQLTVYCDQLRRFKVHIITHRCLAEKYVPYEVIGFPRHDIHPNSRRWKQNLHALKYLFWPGALDSELHAPEAQPPST